MQITNIDEVVAMGTDIQVAQKADTPPSLLRGPKSAGDVIAHSLGLIVESTDRSQYVNSILIRKNNEIPSAETRPYRFLTGRKNTPELEVFLTQGETDDPQLCAYLGCYVFSDFPSSIAGKEVTLDITYEYDKNGTVHVSAIETSTRQALKLTVKSLPHDVPARFLSRPTDAERATEGFQGQGPSSRVPLSFDEYGSPRGHAFDLGEGDEDRVSGEKIFLAAHSFGVVVGKDYFETTDTGREVVLNLIFANDLVPVSQKREFRMRYVNQEEVNITVMKNFGTQEIVDDLTVCQEIGNVILPLPLGLPTGAPIEVTLELNKEGLLHITVREPSSNEVIEQNIEIDGRITEDEIRLAKKRQNRIIIS